MTNSVSLSGTPSDCYRLAEILTARINKGNLLDEVPLWMVAPNISLSWAWNEYL